MTNNDDISSAHHEKRSRFLELFHRIEEHLDGVHPLDPEELDRMVDERNDAWEEYQASMSRRFG